MNLTLLTPRLRILALVLVVAAPAAAQTAPPSTAIDPAATAPRPGQPPDLTPEQKSMIFHMVRQDKAKVAQRPFVARIGADVPPSLELHHLPDDAVIQAPAVKLYRVVVVSDNVVLIDPTTMRVVEVITGKP